MKEYIKPISEIDKFNEVDVITTSGNDGPIGLPDLEVQKNKHRPLWLVLYYCRLSRAHSAVYAEDLSCDIFVFGKEQYGLCNFIGSA